MAFRSVEQFNDDRYHSMFRLVNDKDSADVVFLYRSKKDELVADAHYIKSANYSGYVHCCGAGCPACAKGIKVQAKLFVPMYVAKQNDVPQDRIEFWDRSVKFDNQLEDEVFSKYPNPSEYVFHIVRNGVPNSIDTTYSIQVVAKNTIGTYDALLAKFNAKMPDYYSEIIKEVSISELASMLNNSGESVANLPEYTPIPRAGYQSSIPDTFVNAEEAVMSPSTNTSDLDEVLSDDNGDEELPDPIF